MAIKSFRDRNPFIIGIFSVLLIFATVGAAFALGILQILQPVDRYQGVFNDAAGIKAGDDVKMAGIKSGRVTGIKPDRVNGEIIVTFVVNKGTHVGSGATAEIALETLLGTKFLRLGGPMAGDLRQQPASERVGSCAGSKHPCIPKDRTKTPFDVFELTKTATLNIQATDTEKLNKLVTSLANVTEGQKDQVATLLSGITELSKTLNDRDTQLRLLLDRAQQLTGVLAEKDQTLVALVDKSKGILDLVNARRADIADLLEKGNSLVTELSRVLGVNRAQLDAILKGLHPVLETVKANQGTIDRALASVGPGAYGLAISPSHGPWQDVYIQAIGPDVVCLLGQLSGTPCAAAAVTP